MFTKSGPCNERRRGGASQDAGKGHRDEAIGRAQDGRVHDRLTLRELRLAAARDRQHSLQIMTFEQLAA